MRLVPPSNDWKPLGSIITPDEFELALRRVNDFINDACYEVQHSLDEQLQKLRIDYRTFPSWLPINKATNYHQVTSYIEEVEGVLSVSVSIPEDILILTVEYKPQLNNYFNKLVEYDVTQVVNHCVPEDIKYELKFKPHATASRND